MSKTFCKGGCGHLASYKGWCKIKWHSGNKIGVACPVIEHNRGVSISKFRLEEAKQGKNPMQNPETCRKNHSLERNKKAAESLRKLGEKGLLPQQIESGELREKRRVKNQEALQKLWKNGKHPLQLKSKEELQEIRKKISKSLQDLADKGELPIQNFTQEKKKLIAEKISKKIRERIRKGEIKLSPGWKRISYNGLFLRSNWEKATAEFLDRHKIKWEYESLIIPYYDSTRGLIASTIPDFYLPEHKAVIEVKSNAAFKSAQTADKMDAISKLGYKTFLFGRKQIQQLNERNNTLVLAIKNEKS